MKLPNAVLRRKRPCWVCKKRMARWAVFHSHTDYMAEFDPATSTYLATCDRCVTVAQRQDPEAHNYIRQLGAAAIKAEGGE